MKTFVICVISSCLMFWTGCSTRSKAKTDEIRLKDNADAFYVQSENKRLNLSTRLFLTKTSNVEHVSYIRMGSTNESKNPPLQISIRIGCTAHCLSYENLSAYIKHEDTMFIRYIPERFELVSNYSDVEFVSNLENVEIAGIPFFVRQHKVNHFGAARIIRSFYHQLSPKRFVIIRVETSNGIDMLPTNLATELDNILKSITLEDV